MLKGANERHKEVFYTLSNKIAAPFPDQLLSKEKTIFY
jgi:hypothetical protein